ncbi:MAG: hypothetical protein V9G19_14250 [Tetrasphaera sp.]
MTRFLAVISADGTTIAVESYGTGPAVAIVGGASCDRSAGRELAEALGGLGFTGITYDRRGRGDSGDTRPCAVEREVEDLAAVLAAYPGRAFAHGISSGSAIVLRALEAGVPSLRQAFSSRPTAARKRRCRPAMSPS